MKLIKIVFFCFLILLNSCNGQNKENSYEKIDNKKMVEKFDIEIYKKQIMDLIIILRKMEP